MPQMTSVNSWPRLMEELGRRERKGRNPPSTVDHLQGHLFWEPKGTALNKKRKVNGLRFIQQDGVGAGLRTPKS